MIQATTRAASDHKRVAMVIGSGSVKCAAAIGVQRALAREGIGIDLVVGCGSAGSIFASMIAAGFDAAKAGEMTRHLWTGDITSKRDNRSLLSALMPRWFGFNAELERATIA